MIIPIFRNGVLLGTAKPDSSSELFQKKQSDDYIKLSFTLVSYIDFQIGDYIISSKTDSIYTLLDNPVVNESPNAYKYECTFKGKIHGFETVKVILETPKLTGGFYSDYTFPLTGNAQTFLGLIVSSLNRAGGSYIAGVAKVTDTQNIQFNNWNVTQALYELSTKLGFDWYLDGDTLNFDTKEVETAYTFQVGRLVGLTELNRTRVESEELATVVYGYGSTENLPPRSAESGQVYDSPLLTENRLAFSGVDGESKLENNVERYGRRESIQEFDDIKPEFTGDITRIDASNRRVFYDSSIDFDINKQLASGITPQITFLTGRLIGLSFDISYELATDKITMDYFTDESGTYPNSTIYAEVGDTYKLFDIIMPASYISAAQTRLEEATQAYLSAYSKPSDVFTAKVDKQYIELNHINLNIGELIRVVSPAFLLDSLYEIKELRQKINNTNIYEIKFGDSLPLSLLASLKISNFTTNQEIYSASKNAVVNNQVTNVTEENTVWTTL